MSRDLIVSSFTPTLRSGGPVRTYGITKALARNGPLDFVYVPFGADAPAPEYLELEGVELHAVPSSRGPRRALAFARALAAGTPRNFARGVSPELLAAVERLAAGPGRGRIIAQGPVAAANLLPLTRRHAIVYNAENVESTFRHELTDGQLGSQRRLAAFERRLIAAASETWMVSPRDVEAALELVPDATVRYVPNVVDVAAIRPVTGVAPQPRAIFVGDFTYPPNQVGLRFLVDEVLPRVWERLPEARLSLVGRGAPDDLGDPRAEALGFVDDLPAEYRRARAAVVPLLVAGGSPLKFVAALAYGLPIVATPAAAAGLELEPGEHYLRAEGAEAFADALAGVLEHGDPALGARARELAEGEYSIEALARRLAA
jgi:glycosyltransferase involved in cell wall biosynthesis